MDTEPQHELTLFRDADKIVSDFNAFASAVERFPVGGEICELAVERIREILGEGTVGLDKLGQPRRARPREQLAAARVLAAMARVNQAAVGQLVDLIRPQVTQALQVNIDNRNGGTVDDLTARTIQRAEAALEFLDAASEGDSGGEHVSPEQPGSNGTSGGHKAD